MNFETLLLPDRLRNVMRWNGMPALDRSNVAEHTYRVMFYMRELINSVDSTQISSEVIANAYSYAIIHDLGEVFTGDVSHTIKRKYDLKPALDEIEHAEVSSRVQVPEVSIEATIIVKLADIIDFSFESWKEINYGNKFREYKEAIQKGITIVEKFERDYGPQSSFNREIFRMIKLTLSILKEIQVQA